MGEFFGGLLVLASLAGFIVAIIALIKPIPKIGLSSRKRALLAIPASFIVMLMGGALLPPVEKEAVAATTPNAAVSNAASANEAVPEPEMTAEVQGHWKTVLAALKPCDNAAKRVAEASGGDVNAYELYPVLTNASDVCRGSWSAVQDIDPPKSAKGEAKEAFEKALSDCTMAYLFKSDAYRQMAKVLDGDMRPSAVNKAKESMDAATSGQMVCVAGYMSAAIKAGVSLDAFKSE